MHWTPAEIRRRRDTLGVSQEELGQLMGEHLGKPVSRRAITNWENGVAIPQGRNIRALDLVLGDQTSDPRLSEAGFYDLLAALAKKYADATGGQPHDIPDLPASHYTLRTEDAPSTRRARAQEKEPDDPDEASDGRHM